MTRQSKSIPAALPEGESIDITALARRCNDGEFDFVTVLGPTASGKTKYAVKLAQAIGNAEIISADSRQVYRGMDIGTGKDLADYCGIPYHLIDIADPGDGYNVHRFQQDFRSAIDDIRSRGAFPILCGGTGLYINSILADYDFVTKKPLSQPSFGLPAGTCSAGGSLSPDGFRSLRSLHPSQPGGWAPPSNVSEGGHTHRSQLPPDRTTAGSPEATTGNPVRSYVIGTLVDRETRNNRIDARLDARLQEGMVEEIRGLLERGVSAETLIGYGLEYKFVTQYILGELSLEEMRTRLATAIHQFAKRQMTWFRGMERSGVQIHWVKV